MSLKWPNKDPNETLDFGLDWSRFLRDGEIIISAEWFIISDSNETLSFSSGETYNSLTNESDGTGGAITSIICSGGVNNTRYKLVCRITLGSGLVVERSVLLFIKER